MKKRKIKGQEEQVVDKFEPYRPIVMANINGMDEVLGDRCLTLILEKSDNPIKTRLVEDFENSENLKIIKEKLNQCSLCSVVMPRNIYKKWNNYIVERYRTTLTTLHTLHTLTPQTTQDINLTHIFNKIHNTKIIGRNLELFLPIFFLAELISDEVVDEILKTAKNITSEKKHEEEIESFDVMVYDFISRQEENLDYYSVKSLTSEFRNFSNEDYEWLNSKWLGRALKRLNLVIDKRRKGYGVEVILNVKKATEKLKMFKKGVKNEKTN